MMDALKQFEDKKGLLLTQKMRARYYINENK